MRASNQLKMSVGYCLVILGAANIAVGGDLCLCAPRSWQYNRDVCFGHYQTRWGRWDEACGRVVATSGGSIKTGSAAGLTIHESQKPKLTWVDPPPPTPMAPKNLLPSSNRQIPVGTPATAGWSAPPAAVLFSPIAVPPSGGNPVAALGQPR